MGRGFMGMMRNFMDKMGGEEKCKEMKQEFCHTMKNGSEAEKKEQWEKFGKVMEQFGEHMGKNAETVFGNNQGTNQNVDGESHSWNYQRAVLQKKPEGVLSACPGTSLIEEIEVINETFWPWKKGCYLSLHDEQEFTECPIEIIHIPIEQEVKGKQTLTISVPLTVLPHIQASDDIVYKLNLTFRGPKGQPFGQIIPVELKVILPKPQVDELEVYKLAIKLHESLNLGSFEECAKVVKDNNCDYSASIKALQRK